jgi:hypothetical protein
MCDIIQRVCRRVVEWLIGEDGHRLYVCGLKMGKQLVQVWDVEPATGKVGALANKVKDGTVSEEKEIHDFALECGV